ncbi:MAG: hypothetical protein QG623_699 [Patescibacteria group bacterium]|nr:hypothetical protein [Patescibacteria group bacterium]
MLVVGVLFALGLPARGAIEVDPGRPLNAFCEEVKNGNPAGVGGSGKQPEVCEQDNADPKGESLLSSGGIVDRVFKLISWLTGLLAVIFIMVGGFKFATSGGNKESVKSARNMIIYAMVGLAVILLSNLIFNIIIGIVKGTGK